MTALGSRRGTRIAGVCGVLWVVLALARVPLTGVLDQPSWTEDPSTIADFYASSSPDAGFVIGIALVAVAYALFLAFVAKVADLVGRVDGGSAWVGNLIMGGAALDTALVFAYLAPFVTAVFWSGHGGLSSDAYLVLHGLSFGFLWLELVTAALWLTPLGVAILRTEHFPAWLGWAILVNAAALLVAFFLPYSAWAVVGGLPYVLILIAAVPLVRSPERYVGHGTDHA